METCQYCGQSYKRIKTHMIWCDKNPNHKTRDRNVGTTGTKWIHKDKTSKLIKIEELNSYLSDGWSIGLDEIYRNKIATTNKNRHGKAKDIESEMIRRSKISKSMAGNENWMHNKSRGRGKQGRYCGFWCDSSWELAFIVYHLEHNLNIKRFNGFFEYEYEGKSKKYFPDFITDDGIIEIKGFCTKQWLAKEQQHPEVKVLYEDDMKIYLDYVIEKYGNKFYEILYEK